MMWIMILAVIAGGALIAAQGPIYTRMAADLGGAIPAAMLAFGLGTLALAAILIASRDPLPRREDVLAMPSWIWLGGLIGVYVVILSMHAVPRMGVASYMVCVILGQLTASYAYDRWGAFGITVRDFTPANLVGLILVGIGAVLVVWR